jgi:hypothetical protein
MTTLRELVATWPHGRGCYVLGPCGEQEVWTLPTCRTKGKEAGIASLLLGVPRENVARVVRDACDRPSLVVLWDVPGRKGEVRTPARLTPLRAPPVLHESTVRRAIAKRAFLAVADQEDVGTLDAQAIMLEVLDSYGAPTRPEVLKKAVNYFRQRLAWEAEQAYELAGGV